MKKGYYLPNLNQFVDGFKYEVAYDVANGYAWKSEIYSEMYDGDSEIVANHLYKGYIRAKLPSITPTSCCKQSCITKEEVEKMIDKAVTGDNIPTINQILHQTILDLFECGELHDSLAKSFYRPHYDIKEGNK